MNDTSCIRLHRIFIPTLASLDPDTNTSLACVDASGIEVILVVELSQDYGFSSSNLYVAKMLIARCITS